MSYQLTPDNTILRLADNAVIPFDPDNRDFCEYQEWLAAGNTPEPAPALIPPAAPTLAEKLAAAGLTVEELCELPRS